MFNFFGGHAGANFEAHYRAMPVAFIDKGHAEHGDKVILPPSALDRLASLHIEYPMLFKVENSSTGRFTHCGVLEFVADEGMVYLPHWMMQNLLLQVGDMVKFRNVSLPKGSYVKLQPVTSDFLDISNPKAVLERTLRSYSCLTTGDCFVVNYLNKNYEIEVRETKPGSAISIIETDCQVDFEAPKDYVEPERVPPPAPVLPPAQPKQEENPAEEEAEPEEPKFQAFVGQGRRLDGKPATTSSAPTTAGAGSSSGGGASSAAGSAAGSAAPARAGKAGTFVNISSGNRLLDKLQKQQQGSQPGQPPAAAAPEKKEEEEKDKEESNFKAFQGKGYSLK